MEPPLSRVVDCVSLYTKVMGIRVIAKNNVRSQTMLHALIFDSCKIKQFCEDELLSHIF